jgi:hypothetical protein
MLGCLMFSAAFLINFDGHLFRYQRPDLFVLLQAKLRSGYVGQRTFAKCFLFGGAGGGNRTDGPD